MTTRYTLTLSCPDAPGLVAAVSGFLANHSCNILESQQFNDRDEAKFFMRVVFAALPGAPDADGLAAVLVQHHPQSPLDFGLHPHAGSAD